MENNTGNDQNKNYEGQEQELSPEQKAQIALGNDEVVHDLNPKAAAELDQIHIPETTGTGGVKSYPTPSSVIIKDENLAPDEDPATDEDDQGV